MQMIDGALQDYALTLDKIIDHGAKWHASQEVVTARADGEVLRVTYHALRERAARVSHVLQTLGVQKGQRVATLCWNTQAHLESWFGIMGMGAVCHTLNPRLMPEQLAWMLRQSEASVLIVSADLRALAADILAQGTGVKSVLLTDPERQDTQRDAELCGAQYLGDLMQGETGHIVWGEFPETSPCGLCFTSGTTGSPKGVTYTHRGNYLHTLRQLQADVTGMTSRDVIMPVVPMFHANAWGLPFSALASGAKLVLPGRLTDGKSLAELIQAEAVTMAVGVPTVWLGLADYLDASGEDLPSLRRIMVGGSPMNGALMQRLEARGIEVQTSWGMTELSPLGTAMPPGETSSVESAGRPALGIDLMLSDHEGQPLPDQHGGEGHLWVRGASVVARYFGQEHEATRQGWFPTGDLARISASGHLFISGRSKDLIKSGGEWINPAEIEAVIALLPDVAHVAVIGRAHPKWDERPVMILEIREGRHMTDEALMSALRGRFSSWWLPDEIIRLETMPLAGTGKIDKLSLRQKYAAAKCENSPAE